MKINISSKAQQQGSALVVSLVICAIFSMFLMYYLSLVEQQNFLSNRSQAWNMAIAVTEAGIEDGMEQLNVNYTNLVSEGWEALGNKTYTRTNTLPDGNSYAVTIYYTNTHTPTVVATSYVQTSAAHPSFASILLAQMGGGAGRHTITERTVKVTTFRGSLFLCALQAKHKIDLNGNGVYTDSYDSGSALESVNGDYVKTYYAGDNGDIATNDGLVDSMDLGNANIYGHAHTGTGDQALYLGSNGGVGTHSWQSNHKGVQSGYWTQDANFDFPDTTFPNTAGYLQTTNGSVITPTSTVIANTNQTTTWSSGDTTNFNTTLVTSSTIHPADGTYTGSITTNRNGTYNYTKITGVASYNHIASYTTNTTYSTNFYNHILFGSTSTDTNYYVCDNLNGATIVTGSNVVLALPNGYDMKNGESITIAQGGNVMVYAGGTNVALNTSSINNTTKYPSSFILYCAPTVTSFSVGGNGIFIGVLAAPFSDLTLNGSGSGYLDICGTIMANNIKINGHFGFHYDEALGRLNENGRYLVTSWNEIKPL